MTTGRGTHQWMWPLHQWRAAWRGGLQLHNPKVTKRERQDHCPLQHLVYPCWQPLESPHVDRHSGAGALGFGSSTEIKSLSQLVSPVLLCHGFAQDRLAPPFQQPCASDRSRSELSSCTQQGKFLQCQSETLAPFCCVSARQPSKPRRLVTPGCAVQEARGFKSFQPGTTASARQDRIEAQAKPFSLCSPRLDVVVATDSVADGWFGGDGVSFHGSQGPALSLFAFTTTKLLSLCLRDLKFER